MSTELTGLELRKAAFEALGYKWYSGRSIGNLRAVSRDNHHGLFDPHGFDVKDLADVPTALMCAAPAIESDPGVCWPIALEWCRKNDFLWEMASYKTPDQHQYSLELLGKDVDIEVNGSSPCEAWARVIANVGRQK